MRLIKIGSLILFVLSALVVTPHGRAQTDIYDGKPVFSEGADLGYYLWRDGKTWHLRWTTKGMFRHFTGSVSADGGKLKSLKRIDVEKERRVLYPGRAPHVVYGPRGRAHIRGGQAPVVVERSQDKIDKDGDYRIVFSSATNNDIDGFDFDVADQVTLLRFMLEIDGAPRPGHVEVGRNNRKAVNMPLVVTLGG